MRGGIASAMVMTGPAGLHSARAGAVFMGVNTQGVRGVVGGSMGSGPGIGCKK